MARDYMDLSNTDNLTRWERMLSAAEKLYDQGFFSDSDYNTKFVSDMIDKDSDRRDGIPWNPTLKQWNHLHGLVN